MTAKNLKNLLQLIQKMTIEDMSMDAEEIEERILEAMDHTGLDLDEEETRMD